MDWIPFAAFIIFSIIELLLLKEFIKRKYKTAIKSATASIAFGAFVYIASHFYNLTVPDAAYILVIISLFLDSYFGYYRNLYCKSRKYDRVQHGIGSFSFAIFFYFFLSNIFKYGGSRSFRAFYILILGVFYGTIYEIIEFISDLKNQNKEKMQRGLRDTDFDMVSDVIGSLSAAVFSYFVFLKSAV